MRPRVLFITGGTSGVGLAVARRGLEAGYQTFITGTNEGRLKGIIEADQSGRLAGCVADTSDWGATSSAVAQALDSFEGIDAVVACAGLGAQGNFETGDPERWKSMVLTNVLGPALVVRAALPELRVSRGQIIFIGSVFGTKAAPGSLYSATKYGVSAIAESLRQQMVETGVRVCVIHPGRIDTPWWPEGALPPALDDGSVARAVHWVLQQPNEVEINEIVMRPAGQAF